MTKKTDTTINIRVGISDSNHLVHVESTLSSAEIQAAVNNALAKKEALVLVDSKGLTTIIPADKISFVEYGEAQERKVGFGSL